MGHKVEDVSRGHLVRRLLDDGEERPQVMRHRPQRVRPRPPSNEGKIRIDQRIPKREPLLTSRGRRSNKTRGEHHHNTLALPCERHADTTWIIRVLGDMWHLARPPCAASTPVATASSPANAREVRPSVPCIVGPVSRARHRYLLCSLLTAMAAMGTACGSTGSLQTPSITASVGSPGP